MKKIAMIVSLMTLVLAFAVTSVSAQKVTNTQKATTEKVSSDKAAPAAKACCAEKKCPSAAKACCSDKHSGTAAKSGCSKTCTPAEKAACSKGGNTKTETVPVPKSK